MGPIHPVLVIFHHGRAPVRRCFPRCSAARGTARGRCARHGGRPGGLPAARALAAPSVPLPGPGDHRRDGARGPSQLGDPDSAGLGRGVPLPGPVRARVCALRDGGGGRAASGPGGAGLVGGRSAPGGRTLAGRGRPPAHAEARFGGAVDCAVVHRRVGGGALGRASPGGRHGAGVHRGEPRRATDRPRDRPGGGGFAQPSHPPVPCRARYDRGRPPAPPPARGRPPPAAQLDPVDPRRRHSGGNPGPSGVQQGVPTRIRGFPRALRP